MYVNLGILYTVALLTSYNYDAFYLVPRYKIPGTMYYVLLHKRIVHGRSF